MNQRQNRVASFSVGLTLALVFPRAFAGILPGTTQASGGPPAAAAIDSHSAGVSDVSFPLALDPYAVPWPSGAGRALPTPHDPARSGVATEVAVRELPPAPSSFALVVSAFASLGAYQGLRSLKRIHWGAVPDWYHTGGPTQVGHATPIDLSTGVLAECAFERPLVLHVSVPLRDAQDAILLLCSRFLLPTEAPRGPPVRS